MAQKSDAKADSYIDRGGVCATCGKSTGGKRGYGDWHLNCKRVDGRLLLEKEKAA